MPEDRTLAHRSWKAYSTLFGGFIMHLALGTEYCWGNLNPYVMSYIRKHSSPSTVRYGDAVWVPALLILGAGLSMSFGGLLEKKLGYRFAILAGGLVTSLAVFLTAFTIKVSYYLFLMTFGLLYGIGVGLAYAPPLTVTMLWFPDHKGLVNGIILAGFGGSAFIFDQVQTQFINPLNVKAVNASTLNTTQDIGNDKYFIDESVLSRVPTVFFLLSGCYAFMQIVASLLIFTPPSSESTPVGATSRVETEVDSETEPLVKADCRGYREPTSQIPRSYSPRQIATTRPFLTLWFMFLFNSMVVNFVSSLYKSYGQSEVTNNDKLLTILGSVAALFNAFGRIFWGSIADRFSFKLVMISLCAAMTVLMGSLYISHVLASTVGPALLFIWVCSLFFCFSGNYPLFPTACIKVFGQQNATANYGILFTSNCVSGPIGALLSTLLLQKLHSYGLFILCSCISFMSMVLGLTFNVRQSDDRPV